MPDLPAPPALSFREFFLTLTMADPESQFATQPRSAPEQRSTGFVRVAGSVVILLAVAFQLAAVLQAKPLQSANDRSRWATVWSLVERGTWYIDEIDQVPEWSTIDKVRHRHDKSQPWHFYSSKPPLLSTIVAGLYWLELRTLGYDLRQHTATVSRMLLVLVNVLPMLLALLAFRRSLNVLQVAPAAVLALLVTAGFATMLNPFLTTLNNHTPAAITLVFCLAAMIRLRATAVPAGRDFAIVGFMAALTCCFELPAALFGVISFLFAVACDWRKTVRYYIPAAVVPLAAFFITNYLVTGGIKPFYAYYGKQQYVYVHEGVPSYWSNPQGIDANTESMPVYLFHCVLGHHGILSVTPIFLLTLVGWWLGLKRSAAGRAKPIYVIGASLSVAILLFYLGQVKNYNYGGNSAALRWMLWLIPLWWYGMIPALERLTKSARGMAVVVVLLIPSVYSVAWSMQQPWRPGWIYAQMEQRGWVDYRTKIPPFDPPRFTVLSTQPQQPGVISVWKGAGDADGLEFRIETMSAIMLDGQKAWPWKVQLSSSADGQVLQQDTVVMPANGFASGQDIAAILRSPADDAAANLETTFAELPPADSWVVEFLRGLPSPRPYNSASPRYLQYHNASGEKTAVKCIRGASRVAYDDAEHGRCWQRCDVFYCDEVPFGVAQWIITVTIDSSQAVIRRDIWTCQNLP